MQGWCLANFQFLGSSARFASKLFVLAVLAGCYSPQVAHLVLILQGVEALTSGAGPAQGHTVGLQQADGQDQGLPLQDTCSGKEAGSGKFRTTRSEATSLGRQASTAHQIWFPVNLLLAIWHMAKANGLDGAAYFHTGLKVHAGQCCYCHTAQRTLQDVDTHEDGATGLDLLELVDGRASDVAISVEEGREVLQLLAHNEAQGSKHGNTAVDQLRLPPATDILHAGTLGEVQGVEHVREGLGDARQSLGVLICGGAAGQQYRGWDCQFCVLHGDGCLLCM